ncbi:alcohol dehydrogenase [Aspergillus luchuensis]|uniref:Alcohol dehydrogenase n=1 Tax=Aspergillus kawachii TaxID=1069201 RepID=A0A146FZY0_ASPKA|nr:alcohol dehydrogenase [Aspergillus luchuensis]
MTGTTPTHVTAQRLQGKTALITGGAQGFGKAIGIKFIAEGARVLVLDIIEPPEEFKGDFSNNITYVRGDVTSLDDWQKALGQALSVYGHLDIVVNNAGVLHKAQPSIELSDEEWERVFRVNATKGLAIEWAPHNIRVNAVCPSVGDTAMMPLFLGHNSSEEAQAKMLSSIPLGRVCQPSDVANTVAFLASDEAAYLTGVCLEVDGGRGI